MKRILFIFVILISTTNYMLCQEKWTSCVYMTSETGGDFDFGWTSVNCQRYDGLTIRNSGDFKGKVIIYSKKFKIKKIKLVCNSTGNSSGGNAYLTRFLTSDIGTIETSFVANNRYGTGTLVWTSNNEDGDDYVCFFINKDNEYAYFNETYIEYSDIPISKKQELSGDLNGNGVVDIVDVNKLVDIILKQ